MSEKVNACIILKSMFLCDNMTYSFCRFAENESGVFCKYRKYDEWLESFDSKFKSVLVANCTCKKAQDQARVDMVDILWPYVREIKNE